MTQALYARMKNKIKKKETKLHGLSTTVLKK
jgi:hypothetical protein